MSVKNAPTIVIFAGPNGAGKTTFSEAWLDDQELVFHFINADEFARDLDTSISKSSRDRTAGKLFLKAIDDLVSKKESFAIETTLASLIYERKIKDWQSIGYRIILIYLKLPDIEASIQRVKNRVRNGGHNIPEDVIRRRFTKSQHYLKNIYIPLVDEWYIWKSDHGSYELLDEGERK